MIILYLFVYPVVLYALIYFLLKKRKLDYNEISLNPRKINLVIAMLCAIPLLNIGLGSYVLIETIYSFFKGGK